MCFEEEAPSKADDATSNAHHREDANRDEEQERASKRSRIAAPFLLDHAAADATTASTAASLPMIPPPPLHELLNPMNEDGVDWQAVLVRLQLHPQEACTKIQTGPSTSEYPLIAALHFEESLPLQVVQAMLQSYPDVTKLKGAEGQHRAVDMAMRCTTEVMDYIIKANPNSIKERWINGNVQLHYADNVQNCEIARLLIKAYPESMTVVGAYGDLPIHWAVEYENLDVIKVMIKEISNLRIDMPDGSSLLSVKNDKDLTPLDVACQMFIDVFKEEDEDDDVFTDNEEEENETNEDLDSDEDEEPDHSREAWRNQKMGRYHKKRWNIVKELALASFSMGPYRNQSDLEFPLLHTLIHHACHPDAIWFALRLLGGGTNTNRRRQLLLQMKNSNGDTPLLIAAGNVHVSGAVIQSILNDEEYGYSQAAGIINRQGRLPLHVAAMSGREFDQGLDSIIKAEPRAMETRDLQTHLYPFQLCSSSSSNADLSTIYSLIKQTPSVLQHYHS